MVDDLRWQGRLTKIADAIFAGRLVPFLGADINLCDRPKTADGKDMEWTTDSAFPPSNQELAVYLDEISEGLGPTYRQEICCPFIEAQGLEQLPLECPLRHGGTALKLPIQSVSQFVDTVEDGNIAMSEALQNLFKQDYTPNAIHRFLASLPALVRNKVNKPIYPLIVSACFDSALEKAFLEAGEPIDLVGFVGDAEGGVFQHFTPEGTCKKITNPNGYLGLDLSKRPVLLKLYRNYDSDSYSITEDHYIDYLSQGGIAQHMPSSLLQILDESMLLFLGYNLSVWNQRVILRRLWQKKLDLADKSWLAIQGRQDALDLRMWNRYSVKVLQRQGFKLEDCIAAIEARLKDAPAKSAMIASGSSNRASRTQVFISYSHRDQQWLEKIKTALAPLVSSEQLSVWDDTKIQPGSKWQEDIKNALASAKVAVLLVSQEFLASKFINEEELPCLLEAAEKEGAFLIPVAIEPCNYELTSLKDYQTIPSLSRPLLGLSDYECKEALMIIARKIKESLDRK